jgi:surface polysaccharide O-acyltransferase-like enzyme
LFFFGFATGFFNSLAAPAADLEGLPLLVKYLIWTISGTGPLWFIQVLWLLSLLLLLIRRFDASDRAWLACGRMGVVPIVLMGVTFWLGHKTLVMNPDPASAEGLWNLYKPVFYAIPFLMGYFIFSHDSVQHIVQRVWQPLMACAVVAGVTLVVTTFGQDNTLPQYLGTPLNNLYGYLMCLAMMGWFGCRFNGTGRVAEYMTRSSYGIYIVHYLIVNSLGYALRVATALQPLWVYVILTVAVFTLSPLLYELLRRTPFLRWCVLGEKR